MEPLDLLTDWNAAQQSRRQGVPSFPQPHVRVFVLLKQEKCRVRRWRSRTSTYLVAWTLLRARATAARRVNIRRAAGAPVRVRRTPWLRLFGSNTGGRLVPVVPSHLRFWTRDWRQLHFSAPPGSTMRGREEEAPRSPVLPIYVGDRSPSRDPR